MPLICDIPKCTLGREGISNKKAVEQNQLTKSINYSHLFLRPHHSLAFVRGGRIKKTDTCAHGWRPPKLVGGYGSHHSMGSRTQNLRRRIANASSFLHFLDVFPSHNKMFLYLWGSISNPATSPKRPSGAPVFTVYARFWSTTVGHQLRAIASGPKILGNVTQALFWYRSLL